MCEKTVSVTEADAVADCDDRQTCTEGILIRQSSDEISRTALNEEITSGVISREDCIVTSRRVTGVDCTDAAVRLLSE